MKAGTLVKMSEALKRELRTNDSKEHVDEFGECVGVVEGPTDFGSQKGPELDVRWQPSGLRYCYHPSMLVKA